MDSPDFVLCSDDAPLYAVNMSYYHWLIKKLVWPIARQNRDGRKEGEVWEMPAANGAIHILLQMG